MGKTSKMTQNSEKCKISKFRKLENAGAKFAKIDNPRQFNWAKSVIACLSGIKIFAISAKKTIRTCGLGDFPSISKLKRKFNLGKRPK